MHAMSFPFPILKNDRDWTATVSDPPRSTKQKRVPPIRTGLKVGGLPCEAPPSLTLRMVHVLICDTDHAGARQSTMSRTGWRRRSGERPPPEATAPFCKKF